MTPASVSMLALKVKHTYSDAGLSFQPMETMGDRIRFLRESKGWTQQELADRLHQHDKQTRVSRAAVSLWESGTTKNIKLVTFLALLKILDTTYEYLIWGPVTPRGQPPQLRRRQNQP